MQFKYVDTCQIYENEISFIAKRVAPHIKHFQKISTDKDYSSEESFINLPFDEKNLKQAVALKEKLVSPRLKYIIDIGIGGSNLGTKAVYDALDGFFDIIEPQRFPKIIFADTNDPVFLSKLQRFLNKSVVKPEEVIFNVVSKSGKTTETIVNLEILSEGTKFYKERVVVTTVFKTKLWDAAEEINIALLPIPKNISGRFSVLTTVGLFPLLCAGIDVAELIEGAMTAIQKGLEDDIFKNISALSAIITYLNFQNGKTINDSLFFHPELESLGKWYRQLMAESIGKRGTGITPTVSIGSTDLHSMAQLYLGGPRDKFFTLVSTEETRENAVVPRALLFDLADEIKNKSAKEVMDAILSAVRTSFKKRGIPFAEVVLKNLSPKSLGHFMQFKMLEVVYLARLLNVDPFDQPNVEEYKEETRKTLQNL